MKFIFKHIRQLFKPKFKPSEEDLLILRNKKNNNESFKEVEDRSNEYHSNLKVLLTIYNEAKLKTKKVYFEAAYIEFKKIIEYKHLIHQHSEVRISFLYFIIKVVKIPPGSVAHIDEGFKTTLFASILATKLHLTNKNIVDFFFFWKSKDYYYLKIPLSLLVKKMTDLSDEKNINNTLIRVLQAHIRNDVGVSDYSTYEKEIERIDRVITDYKFKKENIPFFLLSDFFGNKVNTILLDLNEEKAVVLSQILQIIAIKKRTEFQKQKVEELINQIGIDFFLDFSINSLQSITVFKPKIKLNTFWDDYEQKNVYEKSYIGMFNENILIIYGLLIVLEEISLIKKTPINHIKMIAKRSYTLKKEFRLGRSSTKLGDLCIEILAKNYEEEGEKKLKEIYNEITYKNVQKKIDSIKK